MGEVALDLKNVHKPEGLDAGGEAAWKAVHALLKKKRRTYTGGCTTFYSPKQWKERGEKYGLESVLIICYDGGEVRDFFEPVDPHGAKLAEQMREALKSAGFYSEGCTGWYSAVYRL